MRAQPFAALAILLYWQAGPLPQAQVTEDGRTKWSLSAMAGTGQWEEASFDCEGNHISSIAREYRDVGGRLDIENGTLRVSFAGGSVRRMRDDTTSFSVDVGSWATYGGQIAYEGRGIGAGLGVIFDGGEHGSLPTVYFRAGPRNDSHFRLDVLPLTETRTLAGQVRMGVGFRHGFVGATFGPYFEQMSQIAFFGDFGLPVNRRVDLRLAGTVGPGIDVFQYGVAAGLRIRR